MILQSYVELVAQLLRPVYVDKSSAIVRKPSHHDIRTI